MEVEGAANLPTMHLWTSSFCQLELASSLLGCSLLPFQRPTRSLSMSAFSRFLSACVSHFALPLCAVCARNMATWHLVASLPRLGPQHHPSASNITSLPHLSASYVPATWQADDLQMHRTHVAQRSRDPVIPSLDSICVEGWLLPGLI